MDPNPFHFGSPVTGDRFGGRILELSTVLSCMENHINLVVLSPRRYGKTSLLEQAESVLRERQPLPAILHVNVLRCADLSELATKLVGQLYQVPGGTWRRAQTAVSEFLRRIRVHPTVTADLVTGLPVFAFAPQLTESDGTGIVEDVYGVLADLAKKRPAVLVLDEFQDVLEYAPRLPLLLKGLSDSYPDVSLVVAGSRHHLMEKLILTRESPLFGMAQKLALGPMPDEEMVPYLQERASRHGKKRMSAIVARKIIEIAGPTPNDIQHLAREAYDVAADAIDIASVDTAVERIIASQTQLFDVQVGSLTSGQQRVLRALARGSSTSLYSSAFAKSVGLAGQQSVRRAIERLEMNELITRTRSDWHVVDPFLARWLCAEGG
jgi:hypothetical protein